MSAVERAPAHGVEAPSRWMRWFTYGSLGAAAVALVATVWVVGPGSIAAQVAAIGPWFAVVIAIEIATTACDAAALRHYLGGSPGPSYRAVVRAQIAGRAINAVMPLGGLGEAAKMTTLMNDVPAARAVAAVLRYDLTVIAMSLVAIIAGAPVCAATLALPHWLAITLVAGAAVAAVLLVGGAVVIRYGLLPRVVRLLRVPAERGPWTPIAWVLASRLLSWLSPWVVLAATGHVVGVGTIAALATAGLVISWSAMIVPMGLGISDGGTAALFVALGADASLGVTVVIGQRVTQLIYAAIGLPLLAALRSRHARQRQSSASGTSTMSDVRVGRSASTRSASSPPPAPSGSSIGSSGSSAITSGATIQLLRSCPGGES